MLARARLPCEKFSRIGVAALSWRANNVRPYILYKAKSVLFNTPEKSVSAEKIFSLFSLTSSLKKC